jgi:multifunctional 2-oxoglutarate metabolism enzyme
VLAAETGTDPDAAIIRVERLYPLPLAELQAELARYPAAEQIVWVQEEPANMGAWPWMALKLPAHLGRPVSRVSLPPSSAPAGGSATMHASERRALVEAALQPAQQPGSGAA